MFLLPKIWESADDVTSQRPEGLSVWGHTVLKALVHPAVPRVILAVEEAAIQGGGFQMAFRVYRSAAGREGERGRGGMRCHWQRLLKSEVCCSYLSCIWGSTWDAGTVSQLATSPAALGALVTHLAKPSGAETEHAVCLVFLGQVTNKWGNVTRFPGSENWAGGTFVTAHLPPRPVAPCPLGGGGVRNEGGDRRGQTFDFHNSSLGQLLLLILLDEESEGPRVLGSCLRRGRQRKMLG